MDSVAEDKIQNLLSHEVRRKKKEKEVTPAGRKLECLKSPLHNIPEGPVGSFFLFH